MSAAPYFTTEDLEAYLDESLEPARMVALEQAVRTDSSLAERLMTINGRRNAGLHSLGDVWRRHRLSCPTRDELGSFLLDVLPPDSAAYVHFHLETVACRFCQADREDLIKQQAEAQPAAQTRRKKYFQSSAGYLPK